MSAKVSNEQLEMVRRWASYGVDLNGIQKNLAAECGVHLTYMEVRFLLLDHGIEIARPQAAPAPEPEVATVVEPVFEVVDPVAQAPEPTEPEPAEPEVMEPEVKEPAKVVSWRTKFGELLRDKFNKLEQMLDEQEK